MPSPRQMRHMKESDGATAPTVGACASPPFTPAPPRRACLPAKRLDRPPAPRRHCMHVGVRPQPATQRRYILAGLHRVCTCRTTWRRCPKRECVCMYVCVCDIPIHAACLFLLLPNIHQNLAYIANALSRPARGSSRPSAHLSWTWLAGAWRPRTSGRRSGSW